jgi:hypothetical protein
VLLRQIVKKKKYRDDALQWKYIDPRKNLVVERPSVYFEYNDEKGIKMCHILTANQKYELDQSGLWDALTNNPMDLACRVCEKEFGCRRASPLVIPNESVPYFDRSWGRRLGYTPPPSHLSFRSKAIVNDMNKSYKVRTTV